MALLDVSLVTRTFVDLLQAKLPTYPDWPRDPMTLVPLPLSVLPLPPDELEGQGDRALGWYLYHVREDAHTKSQDYPVDDEIPQRFAPMGLSLYYVLTAKSGIDEADRRVYAEQLMVGLAVKTLRDFAFLDDKSRLNGADILKGAMRGADNVLRLSLQPVQFNEAMHYWTSGTQPLRLAAYYEVAATLLEPESLPSRRSRVTAYNVFALLRSDPRIVASANEVTIAPPPAFAPVSLELSPAEVAYDDVVEFRGSGLRGDSVVLQLTSPRWDTPVDTDPTVWNVVADEKCARAVVRSAVDGTHPVWPGIYGATVKVIHRRTDAQGRTREFVAASNRAPFTVVPKVVAVAKGVVDLAVSAAPLWRITGRGYEAAMGPDTLQVYLGQARIPRGTAPLNPGEHLVTPDPLVPGQSRIDLVPPAGVVAGSVVSLRIVVNGAEAAPRWETA